MSQQAQQSQCLCGPEQRGRRVLMVRRLHPAVTMQMLLQTFGVFGSVTGCKVFTHKSGRSAGCASLEFSNHQAACAALKGLQGTLLHGKHVMLQWFDQTLSSATSPVGPGPRGPGQRAELPAGALSEGGSCATMTGRQLPSGNSCAGPVRSSAASCPGLSPFGLFAAAAAPPGAHPFCNSTAAMAAAAAAAAVAAQQQQQQLQHSNDAAAATAAALLSGQHQLPPLVVQQLQRQVSAPLGPYGQLSPTASHIPPSPLTPGSHGGGWEALMSPAGPHCGAQQPFTPQHQQRDSAVSSRGGAEGGQQGWSAGGHPGHSPAHLAAAAAKLSAAMASGSIPPGSADSISMAASLQQLASMQQQALAYAAWQNHQQAAAAAALLQHQFSGQLPASSMLGSGAQHAPLHLLGARSMPSELGNGLSAEFLLQQATASMQQQQQQGLTGSEAGSSDKGRGTSAGAAGSLSRQHSTPAASGLLSAEAYASAAGLQQACAGGSNSAGGADSIPAAGAAGSLDQASGGARTRSPGGSARRKSTGAPDGPAGSSKAGAEAAHLTAKKQLHWEDQRQAAGDQTSCGEGSAGPAGGGKAGFGSGSADGGRATGRSSSHQLLSPLRGYSGSDDTASICPDVNALASAVAPTQQQAPWLAAQQQGLSASQVTPELLASLQGASGAGPHSSSSQQQHNFLLAAAAAAASGSPSKSSSAYASSFAQQQQQQQQPGQARDSRDPPSRVSDSQVLAGGRGGKSSSSSYSQSGMLFSSPSLPGPSSVAAALDAMAVATSDAQAWQQQQRQAGVFSAGAEAEAPAASEAFKHKHKMHLQLPTEGAGAGSKAGASKPRGNGFEQLITTEVLPESPSVQQRQLHAAGQSPFGPHSTAAGVADTGSAWADWSASMAALLSPAHVSSLASRRFEDLITLQHGMAQEAAAAAAAQAHLQQQSTAGAVDAAAARFGSTSSQAAWLLQQGQHGGSCLPAASRPGSLMTGAGSDMFGAATGDSVSEGGVASALSKTRHNSLCLDSRPGLLTLSHMFQEAASQHSAAARPSPRGSRAASPQQQQQQQHAAARRALPREAEAGGGAGFGSFTFQPPVLRSLQASGLSAGSGGSSNSQMICQPFQLPDFFSRDSRMGCSSPRGSVSTPGAAACAAGSAAGRAADRQGVGSPLHPSGIQHQYSENLNGTCIAEDSFSGGLDGTDRAPGSPCGPRHLQHSYSMPARFSAPGGAADALAAAAAAAVAANAGGSQQQPQQHEGQRPEAGAGRAPYGEVFKTIWGPSPAGSLPG